MNYRRLQSENSFACAIIGAIIIWFVKFAILNFYEYKPGTSNYKVQQYDADMTDVVLQFQLAYLAKQIQTLINSRRNQCQEIAEKLKNIALYCSWTLILFACAQLLFIQFTDYSRGVKSQEFKTILDSSNSTNVTQAVNQTLSVDKAKEDSSVYSSSSLILNILYVGFSFIGICVVSIAIITCCSCVLLFCTLLGTERRSFRRSNHRNMGDDSQSDENIISSLKKIPFTKELLGDDPDNEGFTCCICLMDFEDGEQITQLTCSDKHIIHTACLEANIKQHTANSDKCPMCRQKLKT